jgi:hypothetical protein
MQVVPSDMTERNSPHISSKNNIRARRPLFRYPGETFPGGLDHSGRRIVLRVSLLTLDIRLMVLLGKIRTSRSCFAAIIEMEISRRPRTRVAEWFQLLPTCRGGSKFARRPAGVKFKEREARSLSLRFISSARRSSNRQCSRSLLRGPLLRHYTRSLAAVARPLCEFAVCS